jgi:hypothetical protein
MFKNLGKALGKRRKKRRDSAPKVRPGEGIRQVAAVIPPEHEPPAPPKKAAAPKESAPAKAVPETEARPEALPPPVETSAPKVSASSRRARARRTDKSSPPPQEASAAPAKTEAKVETKPTPAESVPEEPRPSRDTLIGEARRIRREKAKALENLPERDRERLSQLARKMLLGENDEALGGEKPSPSDKPTKPSTRH